MGTASRASFRSNRLFAQGASALLLLCGSLHATERFELERSDGSLLTGFCDAPKEKAFPIAILLQSTQKESARRLYDSLKDLFLEKGWGAAALEKMGIGEGRVDEKEYARGNSPLKRLGDYEQFLAAKKLPGWNGKIILVGQGEGGKIAAALAARHPGQTLAIALVSAGGGWPASEELLASFRTEMAGNGFSPQYIHSFLVQSREQFEGASMKPSPDYNLFGFSYQYWDGLKQLDLLGDLSKIECPVYYVHGDKDDRIPSESVAFLSENLKDKKNFQMQRMANAGREIIQDRTTYSEAAAWIKKQL